jgi:1-pyrroline-5-carboxylate dehydrogenase
VSAPGIFRPPPAVNEPVGSYAPGSPEREELQNRLRVMSGERLRIPCVIGGKDVDTGETFEAVMPHRKAHVLADVCKGGPAEVERAVKAAADAWPDWSRTPWEERAAVLLRAAELLAGPWRSTLNAATMLNQSKTAHQAEIDAACEVIDFFRFNVDFMLRIYEEQPTSSPGVWTRMEYRPLEGFVFAVTPFNFTAIGANLPSSAALMGNTVVWKPASTAAVSAYYVMRLFQEAGLPDGVINLVYGSGAEIGDAALASPDLAGVHFTGSTPVFQSMWKTIGSNIGSYRNYPRIVGETGGKDFILAHPSADAESVATAIVRGSFEYQGQKCSASSRLYIPSNLWDEVRDRVVADVGEIRMGDVADFGNFMGAVIAEKALKEHA